MTIYAAQREQRSILRSIQDLHNHGEPFDADLTYGEGKFWKGLCRPKLCADLAPGPGVNLVADVRDLPIRSGSLRSVCFDPPFMHHHGKASVLGNRFGSLPNQRMIRELYEAAVFELWRVLRVGGLLVWKCQDIVQSGKQWMNGAFVHDLAVPKWFKECDLFVLTRPSAMRGWNHGQQKNARKNFCYFWCFTKVARGGKIAPNRIEKPGTCANRPRHGTTT